MVEMTWTVTTLLWREDLNVAWIYVNYLRSNRAESPLIFKLLSYSYRPCSTVGHHAQVSAHLVARVT